MICMHTTMQIKNVLTSHSFKIYNYNYVSIFIQYMHLANKCEIVEHNYSIAIVYLHAFMLQLYYLTTLHCVAM